MNRRLLGLAFAFGLMAATFQNCSNFSAVGTQSTLSSASLPSLKIESVDDSGAPSTATALVGSEVHLVSLDFGLNPVDRTLNYRLNLATGEVSDLKTQAVVKTLTSDQVALVRSILEGASIAKRDDSDPSSTCTEGSRAPYAVLNTDAGAIQLGNVASCQHIVDLFKQDGGEHSAGMHDFLKPIEDGLDRDQPSHRTDIGSDHGGPGGVGPHGVTIGVSPPDGFLPPPKRIDGVSPPVGMPQPPPPPVVGLVAPPPSGVEPEPQPVVIPPPSGVRPALDGFFNDASVAAPITGVRASDD